MNFIGKEVTPVRTPGMPVIKVIGLGGGGGNAVDYMVRSDVKGVEFMCANTDAQALENASVDVCIQLGAGGLGAGADPERGRQAAKDDIDAVKEQLKDADMVFITAGMGGGTGTGSAPVVAQAAREMGILTVGVVSKPFGFERRNHIAEAGIEELSEHVDSLITVPNDKLLKVLGRDFVLAKAFDYANEVLFGAVQGISELVTRPGMINVDFEDLRTVMGERGMAMMGVGHATGDDRAIKAAEKAIANPLLEDISVSGARGLLVNITSGLDFTLGEFNEVGDVIDQVAAQDARVIIGTSVDESMTDEIRVTVVATGLETAAAVEGRPEVVKPNLQAVKANKQEVKEVEEAPQVVNSDAVQTTIEMAQPEILAPEPEVVRPKMVVNGATAGSMESSNYLDIPAFLRRQAD
ncbi:cell division protein FtsZ [Thiomicrorhabdus lithotrophica]|uniref:Cell division protein FtsZ n=1 Tax=Thiomicrorhabdus lithotrophica TaxID=2949997 RepID=A0ABY8C7W9_9GAMM|nr:cell division protein FtsZ [Thiomicrorhabdus lithotrophica]WEJ62054.1 cell division protein FtsZ [Thiomicrorhabdus lithotrophica]